MRAPKLVLAGTAVAAAIGALQPFRPAAAGSFEIAPTTIDLPSGGDRAVFYVTNHGAEPVAIQIQALDWRQTDEGEQFGPSDALNVSPPIGRLIPERRQTIRLLIRRSATAAEQSYRLLVSELPDPQAADAQGVRVLLQLNIPVFVAAAHPTAPRLEWSAQRNPGGLTLRVHNGGARHAKLLDMFLVASGGAKIAVAPHAISYVLAGASRRWVVAWPGPTPGETLRVEGRDGSNNTAVGAPVAIAP
ncbi:MAG TPA: fimbria/pilus periplasmic chaperone [Rhizomicrobium sp.]